MDELITDNFKELREINPEDMTPDLQSQFFKELKKSKFLVPVNPANNVPIILRDDHKTFLPVFSSEEEMKKLGDLKVFTKSAPDIADLLERDKSIVEVVIDPANDNRTGINHEHFIFHCKINKFEKITDALKLVKDHGKPLEENKMFYLREKNPFMSRNVVDGVYTSPIPLSVNSEDNYHTEYPYINRIFVPKGTIYLNADDFSKEFEEFDAFHDIILAPVIKFKLVDSSEDNTFVWEFVSQEEGF